MLTATGLMYHDVVPAGCPSASGFQSGDADIYKLNEANFRLHLDAIRASVPPERVCLVTAAAESPVLLTFDDGGASFDDPIGNLLEEYGWRGHFFVSTDFLGTRAFLSEPQVRDLCRRGHIIGSHSCSHPMRMSACSREQLTREWRDSVRRLSDITGQAVTVASVPGGHFSRVVAETASESGIRYLFTSEPTTRVEQLGNCMIVGRYMMKAGTPASECAALVRGSRALRCRQAALWTAKKMLKKALGPAYLSLRVGILNRRHRSTET